MAFKIEDVLTAEQRAGIIEQRIAQWAAELFALQLNADVAKDVSPDADVSQAETDIATLTRAIKVAQRKATAIAAELPAP